jgi:hypothetical protein
MRRQAEPRIADERLERELVAVLTQLRPDSGATLAEHRLAAYRLYSSHFHGSHRETWRKEAADATRGRKKLASVVRQAKELAEFLLSLPQNLRRAFATDVHELPQDTVFRRTQHFTNVEPAT